MRRSAQWCLLGIAFLLAAGCGEPASQQPSPSAAVNAPAQTDSPSNLARANPASEHCITQGGRLSIERTPRGDEYGVCAFEDNYQCEEWALLRGECRAGGVRVTGYLTDAARYCAITGGRYEVTSGADAATEKGTCTLVDGKSCDADAYYRGDCTRSP